MNWFVKMFRPAPVEVVARVEPEVKSFFYGVQGDGGFSAAFSAPKADAAFELMRGADGKINYDQCPPLAIGVNRIAKAISGLDLHYYRAANILTSAKADPLIKAFQNSQDLSKAVRDIQCAGQAFIVLVGNADFAPSKIATIEQSDATAFEQADRNIDKINVSGGKHQGTYNQSQYGSDIYYRTDRLATIILIRNQSSDTPLAPISAAIKTIIAGYNQNYKTIRNGGRLNQLWAFKESLDEQETAARHAQANKRVQSGGVVVTSGGDLDIKEYGLTAKDMDWLNQLDRCDKEIYNFLGVPLAMVSTDASTFNNLSTSAAMFYEQTVLPLADYMFGIIGEVLRPLVKADGVMLADRENIDALQTKRLEQMELRKKVGVETTNELRKLIYGRADIEGGDTLLVDARLVPLTTATQEGNGI